MGAYIGLVVYAMALYMVFKYTLKKDKDQNEINPH